MFHDSYLFDPQGADLSLPGLGYARVLGRWQALRMVVPRSQCVYQRMPCAGIPRLKLAGFARLQLQKLSPFARYGACVVRQGEVLHIWLWDAAIETEFASRHGGVQRFSAIAHSLLSKPVTEGVVWLGVPNATGVEAQLWKSGQLRDSQWFESAPDAAAWTNWLAQSPDLRALGWPQVFPGVRSSSTSASTLQAGRAWARNLTPRVVGQASLDLSRVVPVGLGVATLALAAWGSWAYAQKWSIERAIETGLQSQERRLAELEPLQQARQYTQNTLAWNTAAKNLRSPASTAQLLEEMAGIFTRQGLVVRELEINEPTVQATLVALGGDTPRLTAVIGAVESHPLFYDARFVDVSGSNGFKFSWRLKASAQSTAAGGKP